ncbi:hypothetical protein AB1046_07050 [Promicromonospora sp. Populi]|uniref:hypothetical protein n=1 Tax=Promicromonospora sp. Populi TaxID=3239420 RepID=UPI0034E24240
MSTDAAPPAPAEEPTEEPTDATADLTPPAEQVTEQLPIESPTEELSVEQPAGEPPIEEPPTDEPPTEQPAPPHPLTAALLNLSGLGLGYLHLRAWVRLVVALAATAGLVWVALPIGREPIAVWWPLGYLGALVLFSLDAALLARRRARRPERRRTVWSPRAAGRVAWATLAVVPLLGAAYVVTQHEVLEQYLAYDLDQAEATLDETASSFAPYKDVYNAAYATYVRTASEHPGTRAADRVPGLVDDLYTRAKGDGVCNALTVVRHFAQPGTDGPLQSVAEGELPGALHDCGMQYTEAGEFQLAESTLTDLLTDHPASEQAAALPAELTTWRDTVIKKLAGEQGCLSPMVATGSEAFLASFDSGKVSALADEARTQVPAGLLKCAVQQFQDGDHLRTQGILNGLLDSYPRAKETDYAERIQIATGIALADPEVEVGLPARDEPEGTVTLTVFNYSPDPFEMVYTGPATGVVAIDACDDCTYYADGDSPDCVGYSLTIPSTTVTIPAGDYLTATREDGTVYGWRDDGVQEESYTADYGLCTWTPES